MDFYWSESAQRFVDRATGRFLSTLVVNSAVDTVIGKARDHMVEVTQKLQTGDLTLAQWQTQMVDEMKLLLVGASAIGRGGWAQMSQADWGWTGQQLRQQYAYLRNFAHDIATGKQPMDGRLLNRAGMYADYARAIERNMQVRTAVLIGRSEERNLLGQADHCQDCVEETAMGWVPIGTLTLIGGRQCGSRCHCVIQTRTHEDGMAA